MPDHLINAHADLYEDKTLSIPTAVVLDSSLADFFDMPTIPIYKYDAATNVAALLRFYNSIAKTFYEKFDDKLPFDYLVQLGYIDYEITSDASEVFLPFPWRINIEKATPQEFLVYHLNLLSAPEFSPFLEIVEIEPHGLIVRDTILKSLKGLKIRLLLQVEYTTVFDDIKKFAVLLLPNQRKELYLPISPEHTLQKLEGDSDGVKVEYIGESMIILKNTTSEIKKIKLVYERRHRTENQRVHGEGREGSILGLRGYFRSYNALFSNERDVLTYNNQQIWLQENYRQQMKYPVNISFRLSQWRDYLPYLTARITETMKSLQEWSSVNKRSLSPIYLEVDLRYYDRVMEKRIYPKFNAHLVDFHWYFEILEQIYKKKEIEITIKNLVIGPFKRIEYYDLGDATSFNILGKALASADKGSQGVLLIIEHEFIETNEHFVVQTRSPLIWYAYTTNMQRVVVPIKMKHLSDELWLYYLPKQFNYYWVEGLAVELKPGDSFTLPQHVILQVYQEALETPEQDDYVLSFVAYQDGNILTNNTGRKWWIVYATGTELDGEIYADFNTEGWFALETKTDNPNTTRYALQGNDVVDLLRGWWYKSDVTILKELRKLKRADCFIQVAFCDAANIFHKTVEIV